VAQEPLRTLIWVGVHCGLRLRSEAMTLRWLDADLARRTVTVSAAYAKSGQTRIVPLNSMVRAALERLPRTGEFVFAKPNGMPYISARSFDTACRRAGLQDVTPHTLRQYVRDAIDRQRRGSPHRPRTRRLGEDRDVGALRPRHDGAEGRGR
jgi:integrase